MTDKFVRPNTSHNGTRDGASYDTAWGGWSEINWASLVAGDNLYVCDTHSYSGSNLLVNPHSGATGNPIVVRGDYTDHPGVINLSGAIFIDANRNFTKFLNLTVTAGTDACISPGGTPLKELTIKGCNLSAGSSAQPPIKFRAFNTWAFEDCLIEGNSISGCSAPTLGTCIQWYVTSAVTSTMKRLTIRNNSFTGGTGRATILLKAIYKTALETCFIEDLLVYKNTFQNCNGVALEAECKKTDAISNKAIGANKGIKIYSNIVINQGLNTNLGGGFVPSGFELSTTPEFGTNDIYDNWCSGLHGLSGFCNPLYGIYRIFNNYAENITTVDIDGCGVLPDHGCHDTVIFNNEFRDIYGKPTDNFNTGFGILILDATNVICYGNLIVNCLYGVAFGNKTSIESALSQSSNIYNNTFINCSKAGIYLVGGADNTTNLVRNNIFTTTNSTIPSVKVSVATWTGESNNCFYGFGSPSAHTLAASTVTVNPDFDNKYRPRAIQLKRTGIYLVGRDFYGKNFYNPPNIGAVDDSSNTMKYYLRKTQ